VTNHVSIKVCRLTRQSDMAHETDQRPTQGQRSEAAKFQVAEEAAQRALSFDH